MMDVRLINMRKLTLKEAIEKDKLAEFIKQNEDKIGDREEFQETIDRMTNNSKSTRQTSSEEPSGN